MKKEKIKYYTILNVAILIYSFGAVFSKYASQLQFFSKGFVACYLGVLLCMGMYAIVWQQVIKKLPLTTAYANKAITVVWGLVLGLLFFQERITFGKLIGTMFVVCGVVLYAMAEKSND